MKLYLWNCQCVYSYAMRKMHFHYLIKKVILYLKFWVLFYSWLFWIMYWVLKSLNIPLWPLAKHTQWPENVAVSFWISQQPNWVLRRKKFRLYMYQRDKQLHTDNNITSKCSKIWYTSDKANLESEKRCCTWFLENLEDLGSTDQGNHRTG